MPSVRLTIVGLLLLMAAVSAWYAWSRRRELAEFFRREWSAILLAEGAFVAVLVAWTLYRAYDPAITHTEQPMDFAFLNASIRNVLGQPEDPWLRGESIGYYYFGYWVMGVLSELTALPSNVSYNLSLALVPALAATGVVGLVYGMVRSESRGLRYAAVAGVAAALLVGFAANLEGVLEFMHFNRMGSAGFWEWLRIAGLDGPGTEATQSWRPTDHWWWWKATRVIGTFDGAAQLDYTIHEFPFFSFILGDLHPHVMSLPFVVLFVTMCWNLLQSPVHVWSALSFRAYAGLLALAVALGGVAFTNTWDLPLMAALLIGVLAVRSYAARGGDVVSMAADSLPVAGAVIGVAAVLILPYLLSFTSQVSGIAPVGGYEGVAVATTRPVHTFIVWGLLLTAVAPFVVVEFWRTTVTKEWPTLAGISLAAAAGPVALWAVRHLDKGGTEGDVIGRSIHVLPYALLIMMAVYTALWLARRPRPPMGRVFALALTALGLLLVMGPELLYVDDSFGGASERMNTVFKLYYAGWLLLGVAAGFSVYYWAALRDRLSGWGSVHDGRLVGRVRRAASRQHVLLAVSGRQQGRVRPGSDARRAGVHRRGQRRVPGHRANTRRRGKRLGRSRGLRLRQLLHERAVRPRVGQHRRAHGPGLGGTREPVARLGRAVPGQTRGHRHHLQDTGRRARQKPFGQIQRRLCIRRSAGEAEIRRGRARQIRDLHGVVL